MWWGDFAWLPGAHQATLYHSPSSAGQGGENKMKMNSWVEIKAV